MPVRVDHAGHQRPSATIDDVRIGDRVSGSDQRLDEPAFHQHIPAFDKLAVRPIENSHIPEKDWLRGALREGRADDTEGRSGKARCDPLQNRTARYPLVEACEQLLRLRAMAGAAPAVGWMRYF